MIDWNHTDLTWFTVVGCYRLTGQHCLTATLRWADPATMPKDLQKRCLDERAKFLAMESEHE